MSASDDNYAIDNARAWYGEIVEWTSKDFGDDIDARESECPELYGIAVRSGWSEPGSELSAKGGEFCITLAGGGPSLRLIGSLSEYGEPEDARLQWQDWGTPWTDVHFGDSAPLLAFASQFCFDL